MPLRQAGNALLRAIEAIGTGANAAALFRQHGPDWQRVQNYEREKMGLDLATRRTVNATSSLTLADKLASMIQPQIALEQEATFDGPMELPSPEATGSLRGYAVNAPPPATPDYSAMIPDVPGVDPATVERIARGREAVRGQEGKRALAERREAAQLQRDILKGTQTEQRDERRHEQAKSLREIDHTNRKDLAEYTAKARMALERYREGGRNARFSEGQDRQDARQERGASERQDRLMQNLDAQERRLSQTTDLNELRLRRQILNDQLEEGRLGGTLTEDGRASLMFQLGLIDQRLQGRQQPAGQPSGRPSSSARPSTPAARPQAPSPRPSPLAGGAVEVRSRQEAEQLPDGTLFSFNGRTFRKQGSALIAVQ